MTLKPPPSKDPFLRDLELEEERILKRIDELKAELRSISRLKFRRRTQIHGDEFNKNVNSRNIDKVFFESVILDIVKNSNKGVRTSDLYNKIINNGYEINYNTLRSYVVKLRDDKKIKKKSKSYEWVIWE